MDNSKASQILEIKQLIAQLNDNRDSLTTFVNKYNRMITDLDNRIGELEDHLETLETIVKDDNGIYQVVE